MAGFSRMLLVQSCPSFCSMRYGRRRCSLHRQSDYYLKELPTPAFHCNTFRDWDDPFYCSQANARQRHYDFQSTFPIATSSNSSHRLLPTLQSKDVSQGSCMYPYYIGTCPAYSVARCECWCIISKKNRVRPHYDQCTVDGPCAVGGLLNTARATHLLITRAQHTSERTSANGLLD